MRGHCGLIGEAAACRCQRRARRAVEIGRVDPEHLLFAGHVVGPRPSLPVIDQVGEMEELHDIAALFRSHPQYVSRVHLADDVRAILRSGRHSLLD